MPNSRLCAVALALTSSLAFAGRSPVVYSGHIAGNSITSGPFAGMGAGTAVRMSYQAITPGTVTAPGQYEDYAIDAPTFELDIGGTVVGAKLSSPPSVGVQDDFPVADGLHVFAAPLALSGYAFECECHEQTGTVFNSIDITQVVGTYAGALFSTVDWNVFAPSGQISIVLDSVTIHPDTSSAIGTKYCTSNANSSGLPALIQANGCTSVSIDVLSLTTTQMPANKSALTFYGPHAAQVTFGSGFLCVSGGFYRFAPGASNASGVFTRIVDLAQPPASSGASQITPGSTWRFQTWFRDAGATTNLSDAVAIGFTL